jgi:hypothetical protein
MKGDFHCCQLELKEAFDEAGNDMPVGLSKGVTMMVLNENDVGKEEVENHKALTARDKN